MLNTPQDSQHTQAREEQLQVLKKRFGSKYKEPTTQDPDELLKLDSIPWYRLKYLKEKLGQISTPQRLGIKQILNFPALRPFMRCRGKNRKFIQRCEDKGDFSHSSKKHWCHECQCKHKAGSGTKGNFYGLGSETGHSGVGYCTWCERYTNGKNRTMSLSEALRVARRQVEMLQLYGTIDMDNEYSLAVIKEEAELAEQSSKARTELQLVMDELARFQELLDKKGKYPTQYIKGELVRWSDKTIFDAKMEVAKTISRLNLAGLKMDTDKYLHVDELTRRMPQMMNLFFQCLSELEELIVAKQVRGEEVKVAGTIQDHVRKKFQQGMSDIWDTIKRGRR